ncbi:hypothetical protein CDCA_CDCA01G0282 [Cyanidium caldarium]|uniref:Endonuclease/exonuclease/phosphatase domain-containing protein n=1 Tax=Cyanidium caldarium TaxID=2771 RepID=A0AAV9IPR5_CYACA|nr:hypothetical protein CDCA_CDCA01G0282 [Cyanidium caldarium]
MPRKKRKLEGEASASVRADVEPESAPTPPPESLIPQSVSGRPLQRGTDASIAKLVSYNVTSLRAALRREDDFLSAYLEREQPDLIAMQEIKTSTEHHEAVQQARWCADYPQPILHSCTARKGYAGTAVWLRRDSRLGKPLRVQRGFDAEVGVVDDEGRVITLEFAACTVCAMYVPNSGVGLKRLDYRVNVWDRAVRRQLQLLQQRRPVPVIWCGDLNCAHQEIDIWNPEGNRRSAGFTDEERASFSETLAHCHLVDTFRYLHPDVRAYSYVGHRHPQNYLQNRGWRLDYFCCSASAAPRVTDSFIRHDLEILAALRGERTEDRSQVHRLSDHCPVVMQFLIK